MDKTKDLSKDCKNMVLDLLESRRKTTLFAESSNFPFSNKAITTLITVMLLLHVVSIILGEVLSRAKASDTMQRK
jgi:hypothetical protein